MNTGQKAADLAMSRLGKNSYTQSDRRSQVFEGYSDCSSLCWKCYEKAGLYIGTWTGEQVGYGRQVWVNPAHCAYASLPPSAVSLMQVGDLIFYGTGCATHVEMYIGNKKQIGHGSGIGPTMKDCLSYRHKSGVYQIRRYVDAAGSIKGSSSGTADSGQDASAKRILDVDGFWGQKTTTRLQQIMGTTADGIISNQWACYRAENPGLDSGWEWYYRPNGQGSELIRALQRMAGTREADGEIGNLTITDLQRYFKTTADGNVSAGSALVKAMQKWANSR